MTVILLNPAILAKDEASSIVWLLGSSMILLLIAIFGGDNPED
jgi:hypothetical protein